GAQLWRDREGGRGPASSQAASPNGSQPIATGLSPPWSPEAGGRLSGTVNGASHVLDLLLGLGLQAGSAPRILRTFARKVVRASGGTSARYPLKALNSDSACSRLSPAAGGVWGTAARIRCNVFMARPPSILGAAFWRPR